MACLVLAAATALLIAKITRTGLIRSFSGVTLMQDADPAKQAPLSNTEVVATGRTGTARCLSDVSGQFLLRLPQGLLPGERITMEFHHTGYEPIQESQTAGDRLYVVRMVPLLAKSTQSPPLP